MGYGGYLPTTPIVYKPDAAGRGRLTYPFDLNLVFADGYPQYQTQYFVLLDMLLHFGVLIPIPGVEDPDGPPQRLAVASYPNPFNPRTTVSYALPHAGRVVIEIFNVKGELVRTLLDERRPAGRGELTWSGRDDGGREVGSGVYFVRVRHADATALTRAVLLR
jgi:hypothetical protein